MSYKTAKRKNTTTRGTRKQKKSKETRLAIYGGENSITQNECPDAKTKCDSIDTQYFGKSNQTWKTCINMNDMYNHIYYLTPHNVLVKSVETMQIPEFVAKYIDDTGEGVPMSCKIMIENKYVAAFVYVCGDWYAVMRLFGRTLNTDHLARTERNKAFYKLSDISIDIDPENMAHKGTSMISIPHGSYEIVSKRVLLSTSGPQIYNPIQVVNLTKGFEIIYKKNIVKGKKVFKVLQRFRQEKILANNLKRWAAKKVI